MCVKEGNEKERGRNEAAKEGERESRMEREDRIRIPLHIHKYIHGINSHTSKHTHTL